MLRLVDPVDGSATELTSDVPVVVVVLVGGGELEEGSAFVTAGWAGTLWVI